MEQIRTNTATIDIANVIKASAVDLTKNQTMGAKALLRLNAETNGLRGAGKITIQEEVHTNLEIEFPSVVVLADLTAGVEVETTGDTSRLMIGDYFEIGNQLIKVTDKPTQDETTKKWKVKIKFFQGTVADIPANTKATILGNTQLEGDNRNKGSRGYNKIRKYNTYTQSIKGTGRVTQEVLSRILSKYGTITVNAVAQAEINTTVYNEATRQFITNLKNLVSSKYAFETEEYIDGEFRPSRMAGGIPYFTRNTFDENGDTSGVRTDNVTDMGGTKLEQKDINKGFAFIISNKGSVNTLVGAVNQMMNLSGLSNADVQQIKDATGKVTAGNKLVKLISPLQFDTNSINYIEIDDTMGNTIGMYNNNNVSIETVAGSENVFTSDPSKSGNNEYELSYNNIAYVYVKGISNSFYYFDNVSDVLV